MMGIRPLMGNGIDPPAVEERLRRAQARSEAAVTRRDRASRRAAEAEAEADQAATPAEAESLRVEADHHRAAAAFHDGAIEDQRDAAELLQRHLDIDQRAEAAGTMTAVPASEIDQLLTDEQRHSERVSAHALEEIARVAEIKETRAPER